MRDGLSLLDQTIAYVGDGAAHRARSTADVLGIADRQLLVELADGGARSRRRGARCASSRGRPTAASTWGSSGASFLGFLRDLEVVASVKPVPGVELADLIDATPEEIDEVEALAERAGAGLVTVLFDRWARAVDEASRLPTPRLLFEMAAIDLCAAEPLVPLGDLLQRLDELEGRLRGGAPGRPPLAATGGGSAPAPGVRRAEVEPAPAGPRAWGAPSAPAPAAPAARRAGRRAATAAAPRAGRAPRRCRARARAAGQLRRGLAARAGGLREEERRWAAMLAHADVVSLAAGR